MFGGVAQEMADLQNAIFLAGQGGQAIGLGQRGGKRLFDQDVAAMQQGLLGEIEMRVGGGRDDDRVAGREEPRKIEGGRAVGLGADFRGTRGVAVVNAGQGGPR